MATAIVLAGQGRYEDKWHDLAGTSHRIALVLADLGIDTEVHGLAGDVLANLAGVDLLVVNAAGGRVDPDFDGDDQVWVRAREGLAAYLAQRRPILALHSSCYTFVDNPSWYPLIGAEWVWGTSLHPPIGEATILVRSEVHSIATGISDFTIFDERYSYLKLHRPVDPYLVHTLDGIQHPLAWAGVVNGSRIVFNALGHTTKSYDSVVRLKLLRQEIEWCLG